MNDFKSKMNEKIKLYSNKDYLDGYIKKEYLTDDGDADIYLNINEKNELFDSRTVNDQLDLSNDIYDFIENKTSMLQNDIQINLHILGIELSSHEQGKVKHIMKEHYAIELYKVQKEFENCKGKILKLVLVGLFSFISYILLFFFTELNLFTEIFSFLFSFSLWVGFESAIYDLSEIKDNRESITQLLLMTIQFDKTNNSEVEE